MSGIGDAPPFERPPFSTEDRKLWGRWAKRIAAFERAMDSKKITGPHRLRLIANYDTSLTKAQVAVFKAMTDDANPSTLTVRQNAWELALDTGYTVDYVYTVMSQLEELEWIELISPYAMDASSREFRLAENPPYRVEIPADLVKRYEEADHSLSSTSGRRKSRPEPEPTERSGGPTREEYGLWLREEGAPEGADHSG